MKALLGGSPLFRKILASILLASVFFLSLLTVVVYYSNEILENALLTKQTDFELANTIELLERDPQAALPHTASLRIYLASRQSAAPIPDYLLDLDAGVHHDLKIGDKAYHVMVAPYDDDLIYIEYDVTEIERSEDLLDLVLLVAWIVLLVGMFFIARILSRKLSGPIAQLSQELSRINPDQRGIRLGDRFEDDEVGRIAQAFDTYTQKMDDYVQKQIAFAAMASHELRSPLTIVQTSADLIASRHDDPHTRPHLEKIQRASANMANMIHALLAVTRDQPTGGSEQRVALRPLVDEIIDVLHHEISAKRITIDNNLAPDIGIEADRTLLAVVLTNLIKNGVKHGEQSSIRIDMKPPLLSITDSGIGIDEASLQHIFDFGYRGADSQGYGVGLYISKLVCDYLGWGLELLPNPGGGIIARIAFPD
ncbi:MAG: HAMP domain-containing histidine kinase [Gammaproteobacteria bacterium]|nr:HAMP domain-containing histidine kinase [Gammaproteobacteria bacterium]MDH3447149.1 HAMP domain-containing histidine kinase [Gammaproteobacteria bacterium]